MTIMYKYVASLIRIQTIIWWSSQIYPSREKLAVDSGALDNLVASTQADIRQILNLLSTWKLSREKMSFQDSKDL